MSDKRGSADTNEQTQTTPESAPPGDTERTPGGLEVPVPTRGEFFRNLRKAAKQQPEPGEDGT